MAFDIPHSERKSLLRLARSAIRDAILEDGSLEAELANIELTPPMLSSAGLFVTLKEKDGKVLRGCIGMMSSAEPLYRSVISTAPKAALEDPRFPALGADELAGVHISLSVLSQLQPLDDPEQIVLGRDGLQLELEASRAVFLPQVATEQGWDRRQLLERLAMKAGLSRNGWRKAKLSTFQALLFEE